MVRLGHFLLMKLHVMFDSDNKLEYQDSNDCFITLIARVIKLTFKIIRNMKLKNINFAIKNPNSHQFTSIQNQNSNISRPIAK